MEINEMKRKIIKKLKEEKASAPAGSGKEERELENTMIGLKKAREEIAAELKESQESTQALESLLEKNRAKLAGAEAARKASVESEADAIKARDNYLEQVKEKGRIIAELRSAVDKVGEKDKAATRSEDEKKDIFTRLNAAEERALKAEAALESAIEEKDKVVKSIEALKPEIVALRDAALSRDKDDEAREKRISQLEEMLKIKEDKIGADEKYLEEIHKEIDEERSEMRLRLHALENEKAMQQETIVELKQWLKGREMKIGEAEKLYDESSGVVSEIKLKLQDANGAKKSLEESAALLEQELKDNKKKHKEAMASAEQELNKLAGEKDNAEKILEAKEESEKGFEEKIAYLKAEIDNRDDKIAADTHYYEELTKEMEESKRQAWAASEEAIKSAATELAEKLELEGERNKALSERLGLLERELEARKIEIVKDADAFEEVLESTEQEKDSKIAQLENELKKEISRFQSESKKKDKEAEQAENEKKEILTRLNEEKKEKAEREEMITQLKSEKEKIGGEAQEKALKAEVKLKSTIEEKDRAAKHAENKKKEILARLNAEKKQKAELENMIAELRAEKEKSTSASREEALKVEVRLKSVIEEKDKAAKQAENEKKAALSRLEEVKKQKAEIEKMVTELRAERDKSVSASGDEALKVEVRLESAIEEKDRAVAEKEKAEKGVYILKEEIRRSYEENESLQAQIEEARVTLDEVQVLLAVEEE